MKRILIVDDLEENLYFLEVLLKGNGFEVESAHNGLEALDCARAAVPDLVVSDILMPVMDGYALCREWRCDEQLKGVPFMFYTATFTEKRDEELAMSLGADCFLIKPQEPHILLASIHELLNAAPGIKAVSPLGISADETALLREYNEALFRKLEKKMADLEQANRELRERMEQQRILEEQLRQAQKMEAVGRFSAGISHDFNNLLTVIIGCSSLVRMKMKDDDPQCVKMDHVLAAADRAKNLTHSLLAFSRRREMKLQTLNLNECIANIEAFLRRIIGEDVTLSISLKEYALPVCADSGHLEQVLMNLAVNARDAMPGGGILSIATDAVEIDDAFVRLHGFGFPGRYAVVSVADSGTGMDEATRNKIFEPFFSTKEPGKGTGLGLAIVYGIVNQHKGHITVYSEPGQGSTFRIYLPMTAAPSSAAVSSSGKLPHGTGELILVVDDESAIRDYLESFLLTLGYRVMLAQDGKEAVKIFEEFASEVRLVLMDVILPCQSGRGAACAIRAVKSDADIVFTSGYPVDHIHERNLLDDGELILMKPLTPTELAVTIRGVLDGNTRQ